MFITETADESLDIAALPAPRTIEESGLRLDLIIQLVIKALHFAGELTGVQIADRLGLPFSVCRAGGRCAQVAAPLRDRRRQQPRRAFL